MAQRSKGADDIDASARIRRSAKRAAAQEDPRGGGEGQAARVPSQGAGDLPSGDKPKNSEYVDDGHGNLIPAPATGAGQPQFGDPGSQPGSISDLPLSHYKTYPLTNVGRDARGRTIPHKRSEKIAQQISVWIAGGADVNAICVRLNMRPGKLKELYAKEVTLGLDMVSMDMTAHIYKRAKQSDKMAIFFAKARMGWRDGDSKPTDTAVLNIHIHA